MTDECGGGKGSERRAMLDELLHTTGLAVLATDDEHGPYTSLLAIAPCSEGNAVAFATERDTSKYENLVQNSTASMLLDTRARDGEDLDRVCAATIVGTTRELTGDQAGRVASLLKEKHPGLADFLEADTSAIMRLDIDSWYLISGFHPDGRTQREG